MPTVSVQLSGSYDLGYIVVVSPWLVVVSESKNQTITWKGSHSFKIKHNTKNNFQTPDDADDWKKNHKSGAIVEGRHRKKPYHYKVLIEAEPGHIVTIDPDYRIEK